MNKEQDEISSTYCQAATIPRNASSEYEGSATSPQLHPADATHPQHEARHHGIRCKSGGRWSSILSRVSRSAASLLNQHSPNLNELLQQQVGNEVVVFEPPEKLGSNGEVFELREEVERLKRQVAVLQGQLKLQGGAANSRQSTTQQWNNVDGANNENGATQNDSRPTSQQSNLDAVTTVQVPPQINNLQSHQISRYSRQLLLSDGFGVSGQIKLLSSRILVIGAGGIGSSLLLYLAAAGIGHVTIVDYDAVERSNLHRQIIHRDADAGTGANNDEIQGKNKAQSAKEAMMALNPTVSIDALSVILDSTNIMQLVSAHDVVVDASDNPATRYLINDACILCNKTLISGSAMGTEGQLTVYNYRPHDSDYKSACYRCLYPNPNPAEGCKSCSDNGVLGPVPGLIGVLQAVEVIKVLTGIG
jgi:molybdopterin/thiamine biosynthesis adenylyltransferase